MKKRGLLSLLLVLVMLAGCAPAAETPPSDPIPTASAAVPTPTPAPTPEPTPTPEPVDFYEFLDGVNAAREAMYTGEEPIDLSAYTPDFHEQNHTFTEAEMKVLTTRHEPKENLTREDLIADAETFFTLLRTTYGAYYYFGGDGTPRPCGPASSPAAYTQTITALLRTWANTASLPPPGRGQSAPAPSLSCKMKT